MRAALAGREGRAGRAGRRPLDEHASEMRLAREGAQTRRRRRMRWEGKERQGENRLGRRQGKIKT